MEFGAFSPRGIMMAATGLEAETYRLIVRVPKEDSAFLYFSLEANEGLCFYSTLDSSLQKEYRDLEIAGSLTLKREVMHLIGQLRTLFKIDVLLDTAHDAGQ